MQTALQNQRLAALFAKGDQTVTAVEENASERVEGGKDDFRAVP